MGLTCKVTGCEAVAVDGTDRCRTHNCDECGGTGSIAHGLEWCDRCHDCTECGDTGMAYRIYRGSYPCPLCPAGKKQGAK